MDRGRRGRWCIPSRSITWKAIRDGAGVGLYDVMRSVGAHEVIVENARHDRQLWTASDAEIEQFLLLCAQRWRI